MKYIHYIRGAKHMAHGPPDDSMHSISQVMEMKCNNVMEM